MSGTLLLADDSITIQKVVELTFAETEHRVVAVGSGHELLERFREIAPDIVLCDVVMPDMSGYDVCQSLKADPDTLHIPVVLLTGTFEPFDRDRAMASGCDAIVTKPFEAKELIDTVEELLARTSAIRAAMPPGTELPISEVGVPDGVASLDFTTTGFDKMVPPPPLAPQVPEHGIDLTASFAAKPEPPAAEEASVEESLPFSETTASPPAPPLVAPAPEGIFSAPSTFEEPAVAQPLAEAPLVALGSAPPPAYSTQPVATPEPVVQAEPAAAPVAPAPLAPAEAGDGELGLSERDVERIARRLFELSQPMIERIAWEVIPDMAEMLVRQRIGDLEAEAEKEG